MIKSTRTNKNSFDLAYILKSQTGVSDLRLISSLVCIWTIYVDNDSCGSTVPSQHPGCGEKEEGTTFQDPGEWRSPPPPATVFMPNVKIASWRHLSTTKIQDFVSKFRYFNIQPSNIQSILS